VIEFINTSTKKRLNALLPDGRVCEGTSQTARLELPDLHYPGGKALLRNPLSYMAESRSAVILVGR
jgi:hypothetical protein